jgi:hypothetical protein
MVQDLRTVKDYIVLRGYCSIAFSSIVKNEAIVARRIQYKI